MKKILFILLLVFLIVGCATENIESEKNGISNINKKPEEKMIGVVKNYKDEAEAIKENKVINQPGKIITNISGPEYEIEKDKDINFDLNVLDIEEITMPASITYGPDNRLYVGQLDGSIVAFQQPLLGTINPEYIVQPGTFEQILGLTFNQNESSDDITLYVSHSRLHTKTEDPPFQGKISKIKGPKFKPETVISGLPVQNGDHANNSIAFDHKGRLFIAQGGSTNAGFPMKPLDRDETPLSGAILVADLSDPDFDGEIKYDTETATHQTNKISGDINVFASGFRNPFDLVIHSNGKIYSTDNGPSKFFPGESISCLEDRALGVDGPDELNLVIEGYYYGHPNRNRGRFNKDECTYYSGKTPSENHRQPIALLGDFLSANGIGEYYSDAFNGKMIGDLIYVDFKNGEVWRVELSDDGERVHAISSLYKKEVSGAVDLALTPDGSIYITHVGGAIYYLSPRK